MHLDSYSNHSLSPEPILSHDFGGANEFGPLGSMSCCFSPPKISIETPSESEACSSLLSASSVISGALEELHSDVYLTGDEWGSSLENFLTSLPDTEVFLEGSHVDQAVNAQQDESLRSVGREESSTFLDIPASQADELDRYLGPPSRCSVSPMSVSPGHSSVPSPFQGNKNSHGGSLKRQKRPHSISPFNCDGMDFNTIIRSSPTCLGVSEAPTPSLPEAPITAANNNNDSNFTSCGTYGHIVPRTGLTQTQDVGCDTEDADQSNLSFHSFQSLLVDEIQNEKNCSRESFVHTLNKNSPYHSIPSLKFSNDGFPCSGTPTLIFSPSGDSSCENKPVTLSKEESKSIDEDRSESPEEEDGPRLCRWVDCNITFANREALSRHIERSHIDQRKGDDFTCFWAACQRRYRPFNARYKLLIHMRVHSGEKPNKCTVSL